MKGFSEIASCLHEKTSERVPFVWDDEMQLAFEKLKKALTTHPVLALPSFDKPFVVETDASNLAVGAVLAQKDEQGRLRPIQYASRTLNPAERNYSVCEREALAVVFSLKKFRDYLLGATEFKLSTDHAALQHAFNKKDVSGKLVRWLDLIAEYEFKITYRSGASNSAADYLSQIEEGLSTPPGGDLEPVTMILEDPVGEDPLEFVVGVDDNKEKELVEVRAHLNGQPLQTFDKTSRERLRKQISKFTIWNGTLIRITQKGIRAVPDIEFRGTILRTMHDEIGHWSPAATLKFISDRFWRPSMAKEVYAYVKSFKGCQFSQVIPSYRTTLGVRIRGLFDVLSMDFAGPLPTTKKGAKFLLVAVEHLTGWPVASPMKDSTAKSVIQFLKKEVVEPYGPPATIISDNAMCFKAQSVASFMSRYGISWKPTLSYAPMSNGRAERMVGTIKKAIKKVVLTEGGEWDAVLPGVLYAYRRRSMPGGKSPYELLYGIQPRMTAVDTVPLAHGTQALRELELLALCADRASRAKEHTNSPARTRNPSPHFFEVGDRVLAAREVAVLKIVKIPPLISAFRGPYKIVKAKHPSYVLRSRSGKLSTSPIHASRLVRYDVRT